MRRDLHCWDPLRQRPEHQHRRSRQLGLRRPQQQQWGEHRGVRGARRCRARHCPRLVTATHLQNGAQVNTDGSLHLQRIHRLRPARQPLAGRGCEQSGCVWKHRARPSASSTSATTRTTSPRPTCGPQPFFVNTDPTDSGTINPGDGSGAATATGPSATLSTAVAAPTTVTADGVDQSTVTVTLLGTGSVPIAGDARQPDPVVLDGDGQRTLPGRHWGQRADDLHRHRYRCRVRHADGGRHDGQSGGDAQRATEHHIPDSGGGRLELVR